MSNANEFQYTASSTSRTRERAKTASNFTTKAAEDEEKYAYLMTKHRRSPGPIYDNITKESISLLKKFPEHSFGKATRTSLYDKIDSPGPKYDQNNVLVSSMHARPPIVSIPQAQRQTGVVSGQFYNSVGFHDTKNYEKLSGKPQSPQRQFSRASRLGSYISKTPGAKIHRYDITSDRPSVPACSFSRSPRGDLSASSGRGGTGGAGTFRQSHPGTTGRGSMDGTSGSGAGEGDGPEGMRSRGSGSALRKDIKYDGGNVDYYSVILRKNPQVSFAHAERMTPIYADSPGPAAHGCSYNASKPSSSNGTWSREPRLGAAWLL